jgi:catechol 2,3-dioxygenase-like lactoylglutathione lyase family enzyme
MTDPRTNGVHHVALTVSKLEASAGFFTTVLGWQEVRRDDSFPAIFVSDGRVMVTLWKSPDEAPRPFEPGRNIGLHHLAFAVDSEAELDDLHKRLKLHEVEIEFAPELVREGPARHLMCREPNGIRMEFFWPG